MSSNPWASSVISPIVMTKICNMIWSRTGWHANTKPMLDINTNQLNLSIENFLFLYLLLSQHIDMNLLIYLKVRTT